MLHIIQRRRRRKQRRRIHVKRLTHAITQICDLRIAQRITDAQAGQSMNFGKGAGHDKVWVSIQPL